MFGAWGNPDHDESVRIICRALDGGINFIDTADVYSAGESEESVTAPTCQVHDLGVVVRAVRDWRMSWICGWRPAGLGRAGLLRAG
jgi:Aldo/keto reductase family